MSEMAPVRIYEHQRILFDRVLAMPLKDRLMQPVEVLPFCARALAYCIKHGIITLGDLSAQKRRELSKARWLGQKTIEHIEAYLNAVELGLDNRRRGQPDSQDVWTQAAEAMRRQVIQRLVAMGADQDMREAVLGLPIPNPETKKR